MAQKILILGTRTLAEHMADVISETPGFEVAGFVENMDAERCRETLLDLPIFWVDDIATLAETHLAICGIATTRRNRFVEQVSEKGMPFVTVVHPTACISDRAVVGEGCFVNVHSAIATETVVGDHVIINRGALIGHHTRIGDYVTVQPGANIAGLVEIGEGTYVGMGALILDKIKIGKGCIIGAGSVVTKDLPDAVKVVGVPAGIVETGVERK